MPSIKENLESWDDPVRWENHGDEWSQAWGSSDALWFGTVLPRIRPWLPTGCLLEIACGHGRITRYLLSHCERLVGVDLAPTCVEECAQKFADHSEATFMVTDGRSLAGVEDDSIDFAFSWDSLVHADPTVLKAYLDELARTLREGGTAFLHHSNYAALDAPSDPSNPHWRDKDTSAELVRQLALDAGLQCRSQELVQWGVPDLTDCFSVVRRGSPGERRPECRQLSHPDMSAEMSLARMLDAQYGGDSPLPPRVR